MKKTIAIMFVVMAAMVAGCARGAEVKVSMKDFAYSPREVNIRVGDRIRWANIDVEAHTVTTMIWDSGAIEPGKSYSRLFDAAGSFEIKCQFHPDMVGRVAVTAR
ncbi:MAG: cupredoxin domain-containing protein [Chloroflexi bacterium]|nr:cupredoxin domain-containing protein [Chloroflexota bacterium]